MPNFANPLKSNLYIKYQKERQSAKCRGKVSHKIKLNQKSKVNSN